MANPDSTKLPMAPEGYDGRNNDNDFDVPSDGTDNDVDGQVDEGGYGVGEPCTLPGECGSGIQPCSLDTDRDGIPDVCDNCSATPADPPAK